MIPRRVLVSPVACVIYGIAKAATSILSSLFTYEQPQYSQSDYNYR